MSEKKRRTCNICGRPYVPTSNVQKYCPDCRKQMQKDGSIKDANLDSGMTWNIGQDGSATYRYNLQGDIDDFALWNRGLAIDELRKIFEAGKQGQPLSALLK